MVGWAGRWGKIQISLRIRTFWSESSLIACAFYSLRAIQREVNENHCILGGYTGWSESLLVAYVIVGFVVRCLIWGTSWLTKQAKQTCAQRRLRSARASPQSDQSSLCAQWVAKDTSFLHADSDDSDQTGRMPMLIFAECTCHFPAGTQHQNDVVPTSMRRDHVASTLKRRHFNVVCPLGLLVFVKRLPILFLYCFIF